ncbi:MAG: hypothetical protein N2Z67_11515 [Acetobacteraceae bacterium]|nr:hypothetical protein [Acetobacteraceae bacterium]MDW8397143.1 hypothetical protein [Acetobacteraceae bacterium]
MRPAPAALRLRLAMLPLDAAILPLSRRLVGPASAMALARLSGRIAGRPQRHCHVTPPARHG